jgi:hypothetical protein
VEDGEVLVPELGTGTIGESGVAAAGACGAYKISDTVGRELVEVPRDLRQSSVAMPQTAVADFPLEKMAILGANGAT